MTFDAQSHVVPHRLEDPVPILFWTPTEFTLALSFMGFGLVMDLWLVGMSLGAGVLVGAKYLARGAKRGAIQHLLWAWGLQLDTALTNEFLPAWVNDFTA